MPLRALVTHPYGTYLSIYHIVHHSSAPGATAKLHKKDRPSNRVSHELNLVSSTAELTSGAHVVPLTQLSLRWYTMHTRRIHSSQNWDVCRIDTECSVKV